jgi:hypothetical protein
MSDEDKVRENRLRRMADRRGLRLTKSRRRDERAVDYGRYWLSDEKTTALILGGQFGDTLDEIEDYLTGAE